MENNNFYQYDDINRPEAIPVKDSNIIDDEMVLKEMETQNYFADDINRPYSNQNRIYPKENKVKVLIKVS